MHRPSIPSRRRPTIVRIMSNSTVSPQKQLPTEVEAKVGEFGLVKSHVEPAKEANQVTWTELLFDFLRAVWKRL